MKNEILHESIHLLICLICKSNSLRVEDNRIVCQECNEHYQVIDGIPIMHSSNINSGSDFTFNKWDRFYIEHNDEFKKIDEKLYSQDISDVLKYLNTLWQTKKKSNYLEIGCGPTLIGLHMFNKGHNVFGIDTSFKALQIAKTIFHKKNAKGLFIHADINKIPFKNESIDLIYGGGVIEHVTNLEKVILELSRVTSKDGCAFNTVPYLSLGSLTYRQIWGNIPYFPILKEISEYIHLKMLGGKHMKFGYELSFPEYKLRRLFKRYGYNKVDIDHFDCNLKFDFIKSKKLKEFFKHLARYRLFWPMVYISSIK